MYLILPPVVGMYCLPFVTALKGMHNLQVLIFANLCWSEQGARERVEDWRNPKISFWGDCLELPFEEESFDLITIAFGLRNLADRSRGLSEMLRVLRPGGKLIVLEFSQPYFWFRPFYYLYLKGILPWVACWLTGDRDAYLYLGSTISEFPDRPGLCREIESAGFYKVSAEALTFSIVALHQGIKLG